MHLNADELIDLAEGTRPEVSAPHLASCERCRRQLDELRAVMSIVVGDSAADMPEPSPLFWDHLSDRVRSAVAAEDQPRHWWPGAAPWWRRVLPLSAVAVASLLIAVVLSSRVMAVASWPLGACPAEHLVLVAAGAAGLAPRGSAEHAVTQMSDDDLRELRRVLKEELARPGA